MLLDELDGVVGGHVVHPADGRCGLAVDLEWAIDVSPLPDEAGGVVEARALAALIAHVPFADVGSGVPSGAHEAGVGDAVGGERGVVVGHAVKMVVAASQERRAAGSTKRQCDKAIAKAHAFGGKAVHIGRLEPGEAGAFSLLALHGPPPRPTPGGRYRQKESGV